MYSLKFKRQRKFQEKYKKNFDKIFHRKIHEYVLNAPQKTEMYKPFLITSIRDINRITIGAVFSEPQCFRKSILWDMFLKKRKKFAKFTGVKRRCWSLCFFLNCRLNTNNLTKREFGADIFLSILRKF